MIHRIFQSGRPVRCLAGLLAGAALVGCGTVKSTSSTPSYGREGPAIAMAREQAEERDRQKVTEAQRQAEAKAAEQQREVDRRVAEQVAAATRPATAPTVPPPAATVAGQVKHVVVVWLKKPGDPAGRAAIVGAREQIRTIPGVVDVSAGEVMKSDRPVVDSTYDVAVVITFRDEQAMRDYNTHPTHVKLVEEVLKPNAERFVVYDFAAK